MAYVPGLLHDVFISYASADDKVGNGLISHFAELLENSLAGEGLPLRANDPAAVDVFLDNRSIKYGNELTEQILSAARGSAVFVAMHSKAYMASTWCQGEAAEFCAASDPKRPWLDGRLFTVALRREGSPEFSTIPLLQTRRYRRFYYLNNDRRDLPFDRDEPQQKNEEGYTLRDEAILLAGQIATTLREMREQSPAPRVFLAHTSPARAPQAEDIKNWLVQHQVMILRASPLANDDEKEHRTLIEQADLFVDIHETAPSPTAQMQFRIALELEKPRMRWLPRGELSSEDSQAVMKQTILVEEPLEKFKEEMLRTLPQRGERHKFAPIDGNGQAVNAKAAAMVLIVGAQRDDPHVVTIETLLDGLGWGRDAFVTQDEFAEPDNWPVELQDLLRGDAPTGVVFVDGECNGDWADKRLRALVSLVGESLPRARSVLCLFPPLDKRRRYRPPEERVRRLKHSELAKLSELI